MGFMSLWFWPFGLFAGILMGLFAVSIFALWIWMIVDAARRNFRNDTEKVLWLVIIILGSWIGALIYLLIIKSSNPKGLIKK